MVIKYFILIIIVIEIKCNILPDLWPKIDENVSNCFGKIRTIASMNTKFRNSLDTVAKFSRIDLITKLLLSKVEEICTEEEKKSVMNYFDKHFDAINITENVIKKFSNEEKDHINIWNNLKDTVSEGNLYLRKFQHLPIKQQSILRYSLNDVLNTFVASSLPSEITETIGRFNKTEIEQIQNFSRNHQYKEMGNIIASNVNRNKKMSPIEMNDVYKFLYHLFIEDTQN